MSSMLLSTQSTVTVQDIYSISPMSNITTIGIHHGAEVFGMQDKLSLFRSYTELN